MTTKDKNIDSNDVIVNQFVNNLVPGKVIDLQFGGVSGVRIKPTVIGLDLGNYVLLKFPSKLNPAYYKDMLIPGTNVVVRYIAEGNQGECVAFSTTIEYVSTIPEKLIFINYPSKIENRQLRVQQREKTHLPSQISQHISDGRLSGNCINGYIVDISPNGCLFSFKANEGQSGVKKCPIHISISITGQDEPVLVSAHVKNNRVENGLIMVGIMFDSSSLDKISMLLNDMAISL